MTPNQLERLKRDWTRYAKEPIEVEEIKDGRYAYGSELAMYRLHYVYRKCETARVEYSANLGTWFFCLEKP